MVGARRDRELLGGLCALTENEKEAEGRTEPPSTERGV